MQYTCDNSRKTCYREFFSIFLPYLLNPPPAPRGALNNTNLLINITDKAVFRQFSVQAQSSDPVRTGPNPNPVLANPFSVCFALCTFHKVSWMFDGLRWNPAPSLFIFNIGNSKLTSSCCFDSATSFYTGQSKTTTQRKLWIFQEVRR